MLDLVPREILENILARISTECITACKCVSKSWRTILGDPSFISMRFRQSIENNDSIKVVLRDMQRVYSLAICGSYHKVREVRHQFEMGWYDTIDIWSSCNGLLLISTNSVKGKTLYAWNPLTRESKRVPNLDAGRKSIPSSSIPFPGTKPYYRIGYGFGYNAITKDYEVVGVLVNHASVFCSEVWRFSLRNYSWKRVRDVPYFIKPVGGILVEGAIHWVGRHYTTNFKFNPNIIIAYVLKTENIREVSLPDYDGEKKDYVSVNLGMLNGYLCVNFFENSFAETWIMMMYGMRESWTKLFNIRVGSCGLSHTNGFRPLCFINKGQEILIAINNGFYRHCTGDNCTRKILIQNISEWFSNALPYIESNVSLE